MDSDLAALIMRLALGPMLLTHGLNKVSGSGGLEGTAGWFAALGFRHPRIQARAAASTEICAGVLLTLGALTAAACAACIGLMTVASLTDHRSKGYFIFKGGSEYTILVAMVAFGIAALGPGDWSLDNAVGIEMAGFGWAATALILGLCSAQLVLAVFYRPTEDVSR